MAPVIPVTATGVELLVMVLLPSCPTPLRPQQLTVPPLPTAHVCFPPAATAVAPAIPVTVTGVDELVVVPLPSWP